MAVCALAASQTPPTVGKTTHRRLLSLATHYNSSPQLQRMHYSPPSPLECRILRARSCTAFEIAILGTAGVEGTRLTFSAIIWELSTWLIPFLRQMIVKKLLFQFIPGTTSSVLPLRKKKKCLSLYWPALVVINYDLSAGMNFKKNLRGGCKPHITPLVLFTLSDWKYDTNAKIPVDRLVRT